MTVARTPPPQTQTQQPGREREMRPKPRGEAADYVGSGKLAGKVALVTGGDSGIGRAVAIGFAKAGGRIVNTASVTAYHGSPKLPDCSATRGAIVAFATSTLPTHRHHLRMAEALQCKVGAQ